MQNKKKFNHTSRNEVRTSFMSIEVQLINLLISRNMALNFSLIFETVLALFLCYLPGMDEALRMYPLK